MVELVGHRLTFDNLSTKDDSGKCAALMTGDSADLLLAVLYRIDPAEKTVLDGYEGLGVEYRDAFVSVQHSDLGPIEALIYYATNLQPGIAPYDWYRQHVLHGARENSLPAAYIAAIESCQVVCDPDPERAERELSIYPD